MKVTNGGLDFSIPSFVKGDQDAKDIRKVYEQIDALVPQNIWDDLLARHDQYVLEHEDD